MTHAVTPCRTRLRRLCRACAPVAWSSRRFPDRGQPTPSPFRCIGWAMPYGSRAVRNHTAVSRRDSRQRFPHHTLLVSPLCGDMQMGYLLPADRYGRGLYQEEPSILAPGCLETLIDAIADRISAQVQT